MKITVLCVGKIKEGYFRDAISEYSKRLGRYCKALEDAILEKEAGRLLAKLPKDAYTIALAIEGKKLDSVSLAKKVEQLGVLGNSHLVFIIGGSLGLHASILRGADFLLSFSDMTFPHQLMRVILLEQIYRGFRITAGEPYHK